MRVVHVGKIYRVSKNESGYLIWIPKRLAEEMGVKNGDRIALLSDGSMIIILPEDKLAEKFSEVGALGEIRDIG